MERLTRALVIFSLGNLLVESPFDFEETTSFPSVVLTSSP
jgi:hypothetical protein